MESSLDETLAAPELEGSSSRPARPRKEGGEKIGRYVVLERLGAGAMGVVYAAYDPQLDRKVALKLLRVATRAGEGEGEGPRRLLREAQAMARLSHPNVVAVHDVGTTDDGEVFVAMEFVDGMTLRDWLDAHAPAWPETVERLVAAGRGLAHAHAAGLVHRDFKPDNVMVDASGRVRVMDFGLAHGAHADAAASSDAGPDVSIESGSSIDLRLTMTGTLLGTPAYMAPEQYAHATTDARTDQFAFCVTLYEALFGRRPFVGDSYAALSYAVLEGDPPAPPADHDVPGPIVDAVLRGMARDPRARWPAMTDLLDALARHGRPRRAVWPRVVAGGAVAAAFATIAALAAAPPPKCAGFDAELDGVWDPARREALRTAFAASKLAYAEDTADRAVVALDAYATDWVAAKTSACQATQRGERSAALLDAGMACLQGRLDRLDAVVDVLAEADAETVTQSIQVVASLPRLAPCGDPAFLTAEIEPPTDAAQAAEVEAARRRLAEAIALGEAGKVARAEEVATEVLAEAEEIGYGPFIARVEYALGERNDAAGHFADSRRHLERAYYEARRVGATAIAAQAATSLVDTLSRAFANLELAQHWARLAEVEVAAHDGAAELREELLTQRALLEISLGEFATAEATFSEAIALNRQLWGEDHPNVANALNKYGVGLYRAGMSGAARPYFAQALQIERRAYGDDHPSVAMAYNNVGAVEFDAGDLDAAEAAHRTALTIRQRVLRPDHPHLAMSYNNLGNVAYRRRDYETALQHHRRALRIREEAYGPDHPETGMSQLNIGNALEKAESPQAALPHFLASYDSCTAPHGGAHVDCTGALLSIARIRMSTGDLEGALRDATLVVALHDAAGRPHRNAALALVTLGRANARLGHFDEATAALERAIEQHASPALGSDPTFVAEAKRVLAETLHTAGRDPTRVQTLAGEAIALYEAAGTRADAKALVALRELAAATR